MSRSSRSPDRRFFSAGFFAACLSLAFGVSTLAACSGESGYGAELHESAGESRESMLHRPPIQMCPDFVRTCAPSETPICNPCCTCERNVQCADQADGTSCSDGVCVGGACVAK